MDSPLSYTEDHTSDRDLYNPALTYAYNSQTQSSASIDPFELFLSRALGLISANVPQPSSYSPTGVKKNWKQWLVKAITDTQDKLEATKARYKRTFDKRLRQINESINPVINSTST